MLSEEDSDTEDLNQLNINEHYAKAYAFKKEREELGRLKEKYGSDADEIDDDEEDSEDLETEDEDGEELTPGVDAAIFRLLAKIKRKDPDIYEKDKAVFDEEKQRLGNRTLSTKAPKDKSKPITMRQQKLAAELESVSRSPSPLLPTHVQEQQQLRHETIAAFHHAVDDDDDLLVPREKTKDELQREEEEYQEFLKREVGDDLKGLIEVDKDQTGILEEVEDHQHDVDRKKSKKKKAKTIQNKERDDQEFLMNYILNRGWLDRTSKRLPTYTEVTSVKRSMGKRKTEEAANELESSKGGTGTGADSLDDEVADNLDAEDEFDDIADVFESSYNFRFEELDASAIARHPRNLASTVRRQDTTRKEARERRKARKEEELLKKKEEVKRLKALKMKEMKSKLERIGREGGWKDLEENEAFQELDLNGDWDPEAHDRQMANIHQMEELNDQDEGKPSWGEDIDINDIIPSPNTGEEKIAKKRKSKKKRESADDGEVGVDVDAMDADNQAHRFNEEEEQWDGTEEMRKRKLDEYMDELYAMEFNDMVGGMPTRFKYTTSGPESYGLSAAEILAADDKDLNEYVGIKKYAPYRKARWDSKRPERLKEFKQKMGEKLGQPGEDGDARPVKKRKGKKERQKLKATEATGTLDETQAEKNSTHQKRKREDDISQVNVAGEEEAVNPTKKRKRRHKKAALNG